MLQSTDVVFSVIQKEFDYERDRKGKIESKAGIIVSFEGLRIIISKLRSSIKHSP